MKTQFDINEVFVIVDNYGEGISVDDIVYTDGDEAETACKKYNIGQSYQNAGSVVSIYDYGQGQYNRGSENARYD